MITPRFLHGPSRLGLTACVLGLALVAGACGNKDSPAQQTPGIPGSVPTAGAIRSEQAEEATITIESGKFSEESISLQVDEPVVIHVVNKDATAYRFTVPGLVATTPAIAASTTTDVSMTVPNSTKAEGQLLPAQGDQPLDTIAVDVQGPSGTT